MSTIDYISGVLSAVGSALSMLAMFISACASVWVAVKQHQAFQRHDAKLDRILDGGGIDSPDR